MFVLALPDVPIQRIGFLPGKEIMMGPWPVVYFTPSPLHEHLLKSEFFESVGDSTLGFPSDALQILILEKESRASIIFAFGDIFDLL